jgi:hypothetical protein
MQLSQAAPTPDPVAAVAPPVPAADQDLIDNELALLGMLGDLKSLQAKFKLRNDFNLFDAVGMQRQEIRHSRFLAYLLDPRNPHGLGSGFLRAVLVQAVSTNRPPNVSALRVETADLDLSTVYCERDHFDVSVEIPSLKLLFVIENKIDALESQNQLNNYRKLAIDRYTDFNFLGVFLTVTGYQGDNKAWSAMGYEMIIAALKRACEHASLPPDSDMAIRHYIALIERNIVASQALIDACKALYKQHRTAIDLVVTHGQQSALKEAFLRFEKGKPIKTASVRSTTVYFFFNSWDYKGHPNAITGAWPSTLPVLLWFQIDANRFFLRLEVGPLESTDGGMQRAALVERLRESFGVKGGAKDTSAATFTRICKWEENLGDEPDEDMLFNAMEKLWKKPNKSPDTIVEDALKKVSLPTPVSSPVSASPTVP